MHYCNEILINPVVNTYIFFHFTFVRQYTKNIFVNRNIRKKNVKNINETYNFLNVYIAQTQFLQTKLISNYQLQLYSLEL